MKNIPYQRFPAGVAMDASIHCFQGGAYTPPKVSCLTVTRGNIDFLKTAYQSFKFQTWPNKELVIVCDAPSPEFKTMVESDEEVIYVEIQAGLSLGELRNLSISKSTGDFVCQWDDDDLYAPERISVSMGVLLESSVDAVFLNSWVVWWMERNLMCISPSRIWEGSMLARRSIMSIYPSLKKGEDSVVTKWIIQNFPVAVIDYPQLYCYRITGHNTWNDAHFESLFSAASKHFKPEEFNQVFALPCFASLQS
jgi:glycosyltransferase involved in cell wall biosynthesis